MAFSIPSLSIASPLVTISNPMSFTFDESAEDGLASPRHDIRNLSASMVRAETKILKAFDDPEKAILGPLYDRITVSVNSASRHVSSIVDLFQAFATPDHLRQAAIASFQEQAAVTIKLISEAEFCLSPDRGHSAEKSLDLLEKSKEDLQAGLNSIKNLSKKVV